MNTTTKYLHDLPFWDYLNNAEKDLISNNAYIRYFDKDSYILHSESGEDIGLMVLVEGRIRAYLLSPDGREVTLFSLPDQNICIFSALSLFNQITFQVFLASDCRSKALVINMSIMEQLMRNNLHFRCYAYELVTVLIWLWNQCSGFCFRAWSGALPYFLSPNMTGTERHIFTLLTTLSHGISERVARE